MKDNGKMACVKVMEFSIMQMDPNMRVNGIIT